MVTDTHGIFRPTIWRLADSLGRTVLRRFGSARILTEFNKLLSTNMKCNLLSRFIGVVHNTGVLSYVGIYTHGPTTRVRLRNLSFTATEPGSLYFAFSRLDRYVFNNLWINKWSSSCTMINFLYRENWANIAKK